MRKASSTVASFVGKSSKIYSCDLDSTIYVAPKHFSVQNSDSRPHDSATQIDFFMMIILPLGFSAYDPRSGLSFLCTIPDRGANVIDIYSRELILYIDISNTVVV